jgi:hypothetical protein
MASLKWKRMTVNELARKADSMSPEESKAIIQSLDNSSADWEEKVRVLIQHTENKPCLEAIGTAISPEQFFCLLGFTDFKKFSPLLVGMAHETFRKLLLQATQEQLKLLKHQGMSEPLQHQITLYSHEITAKVTVLNHVYEKLNFRIEGIDVANFESEERIELWQDICRLSESYHELMHECSVVLLFAWNTERSDLIDQLTISKEKCHRVCRFSVGFPTTGREKSSGMFKLLDEKLFAVYGNTKNPADFEALSDDENAMEGLAKFSIWYVQDYWDLGLLPNIGSQAELDLDSNKYSEKERVSYRNQLLRQVQENLAQLGLETVLDLKKAWIYSRKSLIHYLELHKVETR